jgi:plasmid stabilization system protein ParE
VHNWNLEIAEKFVKSALHTVDLLTKNPYLGKYKTDLKCNEILISKHISLHYQIINDCIVLLFFWDNRQKAEANVYH